MNYTDSNIQTHFGDVYVAQIGPQDRTIGYSPIVYKLSYINNLPEPITIEWRSGFKFTLPPTLSMTCNKLIMRVEIQIHSEVKNNIQRILSAVDDSSSVEMIAMRDAFSIQVKNNFHNTANLVLEYPLTMDKLREAGGTLYYQELDCLVSLLPFDLTPPHPCSEEGRKQKILLSSPVSLTNDTFGYAIEIIDNKGEYGERFLNIGNVVYKVVTKKDATKRNGVYVVTNSRANVLDSKSIKFYEFETADENLNLFKTHESALQLGDTALARKLEVANLEQKLTVQRADLQTAKHSHELLMLEKEKEAKDFEAIQSKHALELEQLRDRNAHEIELERQRTKDMYEAKSHIRKDSSEAIKILPSIVIGIGAVFLALKAFF